MRIISGRLKGRKLHTFKGTDVRPTADRVREALFNILVSRPADAQALDLFSGTGALGIEAISRGAKMAVFVDCSVQALTVLRKNIDHCGLRDCTRTIQWDIAKNLNCLKSYPDTFDLVFLDPPYRRELISRAIHHLLQAGCLAPEALIVAEHEADFCSQLEALPLTCTDNRRYGRTAISFYRYDP